MGKLLPWFALALLILTSFEIVQSMVDRLGVKKSPIEVKKDPLDPYNVLKTQIKDACVSIRQISTPNAKRAATEFITLLAGVDHQFTKQEISYQEALKQLRTLVHECNQAIISLEP